MADKYSFLVIRYPKADTGMEALAALRTLSDEGVVWLKDAVAVTKTPKGKIKIHQTRDDSVGKGFLKGGLIGVAFGVLFGPAGWIALGAAAGGFLGAFDRGIKNKLLKELGKDMTPDQSAVAILVEHADWETAVARMKAHGFGGKVVVKEIIEEDTAEVERLLQDPKTVAAAPTLLTVAEPVAPVAKAPPAKAAAPAAEAATTTPRAARMRVVDIEGVGPAYAEKLAQANIRTTSDLLALGASGQGRKAIARETGISEKLILEWVNAADLMRIPGVGPQYSDLLEAAGVDSPAELTQRNAANLAITFQEVVAARPGIVRRIPTESDIKAWAEAASKLDKVVEH